MQNTHTRSFEHHSWSCVAINWVSKRYSLSNQQKLPTTSRRKEMSMHRRRQVRAAACTAEIPVNTMHRTFTNGRGLQKYLAHTVTTIQPAWHSTGANVHSAKHHIFIFRYTQSSRSHMPGLLAIKHTCHTTAGVIPSSATRKFGAVIGSPNPPPPPPPIHKRRGPAM
jgi:hypothetical protein